ncbi:MAG: hypothetical protein LBT91_00365 [Bifidobacteriaceae bacterium]|jgi:hypothetical protein|nr:hypothetical protein [Bifidobacteriaceae bacterium]
MSELFSIKKLSIKKAYIKRTFILGIIFLFGICTFISGFNINSYAASSSTVLPISRGGTNANTAAQASSNILGSNFANYDGVLPVVKGGTQAVSAMDASYNITGVPTYRYNVPNKAYSQFVKVLDLVVSTATYWNEYLTQTLEITGLTERLTPQDSKQYILTFKGLSGKIDNFANYIFLTGFHRECQNIINRNDEAFWITEPIADSTTTKRLKVYINTPRWSVNSTIRWTALENYLRSQAKDFTSEAFLVSDGIPEGANIIHPYCASFISPSPSPT